MLKPYHHKNRIEAGCDEAGRGCLAGPVVAAAVILPQDFFHPYLNDSKKLSPARREELKYIIEESAVAFAVSYVDNITIDEINILNASILAMHQAVKKLVTVPECILVDGNHFKPYHNIPYQCIVKGDATYASIAAASILAKTYRDAFMKEIHSEYEMYGWNKNKGYPTQLHRNAITIHGITPYHRKSYNLFDTQTKMHFTEYFNPFYEIDTFT